MERECETFPPVEKRHWKTPLMNQKVNNLGSSETSLKIYFDVTIGP